MSMIPKNTSGIVFETRQGIFSDKFQQILETFESVFRKMLTPTGEQTPRVNFIQKPQPACLTKLRQALW